jgi:hypothetical protein
MSREEKGEERFKKCVRHDECKPKQARRSQEEQKPE